MIVAPRPIFFFVGIVWYECSLAALTAFFFLHLSGKKDLAKWSVAIGDHYAEKILACEPLAFNTSLCTAPGESIEKYAYFKGSVYYRKG